jgi:hypothetical protein
VSFGVRYELVRPRDLSATRLRNLLPPGTKPVRGRAAELRFALERRGRRYVVLANDVAESDPTTLVAACDILEGSIALQVAARAPEHVFIHAGVVVWQGRALLLPARSMAGKSTLVRFLVRNGADYYSDEYAVLNEAGQVLPYPRRLALRRARGGPRKIALLRPRAVARRVGWVVGLRFSAEDVSTGHHGALTVAPITAGQTALLLIDNAVAARVSPERVLPAVRAAASGAVGFTGTRGEAAPSAKALLARCKGRGHMVSVSAISRRM